MGSFYNVLVDRLPNDQSVIRGRSECTSCHKQLKWYDLIPIFSFIRLKGRCRYCGEKLSYQYLASELAVGGLFSLCFFMYKDDMRIAAIVSTLALWSMLFVVALMDQKYGIIIDQVLIAFAAVGVIAQMVGGRGILQIFLGALGGLAFYGFIYIVSLLVTRKECFGMGDVLLLTAVGVFFPPIQTILTGFLAFYCSIVFVLYIFVRDKNLSRMQEIPFGPSICIAAFIMSLWGDRITHFIVNLLGF